MTNLNYFSHKSQNKRRDNPNCFCDENSFIISPKTHDSDNIFDDNKCIFIGKKTHRSNSEFQSSIKCNCDELKRNKLNKYYTREKNSCFTPEELNLVEKIDHPIKRNTTTAQGVDLDLYINKFNKEISNIRMLKTKTNLEKEIEKYQPYYKTDYQNYISISDRHKFMAKHFTQSYSNVKYFYLDVVKKGKDRQFKTSHLESRRLCEKAEAARSYLKPSDIKRVFSGNFYFSQYRHLIHSRRSTGFNKIWNPYAIHPNQVLKFLVTVKHLWHHEEIYYSQEGVLEYLMNNYYDFDKTIERIKQKESTFLKFIIKYDKNRHSAIKG